MAKQTNLEKEYTSCALCVCILPSLEKGTRYCSNTSSRNYEEKKTPAKSTCPRFIPKVRL